MAYLLTCPELTESGVNLLTQNFADVAYLPSIVVGTTVRELTVGQRMQTDT